MLKHNYALYTSNKMGKDITLIAICTSEQNAQQLASVHSKFTLTESDLLELSVNNGTQRQNENNYHIDVVEVDSLF